MTKLARIITQSYPYEPMSDINTTQHRFILGDFIKRLLDAHTGKSDECVEKLLDELNEEIKGLPRQTKPV